MKSVAGFANTNGGKIFVGIEDDFTVQGLIYDMKKFKTPEDILKEFDNMVDNYLGAAKGEYISIYDIKMTCPLIPSIKGIKAPMVLLRQSCITFTGDEA